MLMPASTHGVKYLLLFMAALAVSNTAFSQQNPNALITFQCTIGTGGPVVPSCKVAEKTSSGQVKLTAVGTCSGGFTPSAFQYADDDCFFSYIVEVDGTGWNNINYPGPGCPAHPLEYAMGYVQAESFIKSAAGDAIYKSNITQANCTGFGGFSTGPSSDLYTAC